MVCASLKVQAKVFKFLVQNTFIFHYSINLVDLWFIFTKYGILAFLQFKGQFLA